MGLFDSIKKFVPSSIKSSLKDLIVNYYAKKTMQPFDISSFYGKRIAIIGGADSATKAHLGKYIDDFDIVVRVNRGVSLTGTLGEYIGTRTDILFSGLDEHPVTGCGKIEIKKWRANGVKKVYYTFYEPTFKPFLDNFLLKNRGRLPLFQVSKKDYDELKVNYKLYPTTGFSTIYHLLKADFKELYITGFTFFRTAHQIGYNNVAPTDNVVEFAKSTGHDPDKEFQIFSDLIKLYHHKHIKLDDSLIAILSLHDSKFVLDKSHI